jgi:hypothetical protein
MCQFRPSRSRPEHSGRLIRPSQDRKRPDYLTLKKPSLSPLQIRRRRMARHRWRQRHLRPSLQLIIRRALRWHCGRRHGRRDWRGRLGVSPRRQPPLHPRRAHNGRSRLHPLLVARPEHALSLPPQSIRREHRTSRVQTDTEHNAFHFIPSFAARALFLNRRRQQGQVTSEVFGLASSRFTARYPQYTGILGLNRK